LEIETYTGLKRILYAGKNSYVGMRYNLINEAAFRQEVILAAILVPIALMLDITIIESVALIVAVLFVLIVELLNTAIEAAVDRIGTDFHQLSGLAKDTASAAVTLSLIVCVLVWGGVIVGRYGG
jgi:diacylglycerol kinase (ATP)